MTSAFPFDPRATDFSPSQAGFLCDAAAQAYESEASCRQWASDNGFREAFHFLDSKTLDPLSGTQGFVAQGSDAVLVAFRGTEPKHMADVLSDLRGAERADWQGLGKVHGVVNDRDIVPRVAPYTLDYCHYGRQYFFDKTGNRTDTASSVETLPRALELYRTTLRAEDYLEMVKALPGALRSTDDRGLLERLEEAIDLRRIVAAGTERITDHLVSSGYRPLFKAAGRRT